MTHAPRDATVQLRFPLLCIVTYKGYRLVAMSLLPVGPSTLVYVSRTACWCR